MHGQNATIFDTCYQDHLVLGTLGMLKKVDLRNMAHGTEEMRRKKPIWWQESKDLYRARLKHAYYPARLS